MMQAEALFNRFPPYIQEYIYANHWDAFREVQLQAASTLFETNHHLLLSSSTASGKTEACIFPILTKISENPDSDGVKCLYIAPLKSLINDQFLRMEDVLKESGVPVFHWHGDVAQSQKNNFLKKPYGILQITPESLESMLFHRKNDIARIFHGLMYVVIDEIHTLIGTDRGNQILCLLQRITRLIGVTPIRIGLSATIGSLDEVAAWLRQGTTIPVDAPKPTAQRMHYKIGMEHFYIATEKEESKEKKDEEKPKSKKMDAGYEYLYDVVHHSKSLVFSNSREETEYVTATLRQIAKNRHEKDVFYIHHGNLSAALREEAERTLKDNEVPYAVTCATVTMELGIDIGKLERVAQIESPYSVSSFLQRLGRSGRRDLPPEMFFLFREEDPLPNAPLPTLIPWSLLRGIAILELYRKERFIEPPHDKKQPFSLCFHQTLAILAGSGELTPKALADIVLSLPAFSHISKEDYRALLLSMIKQDYLEMTDEKGLIVGLKGETLLQSFKFYAVFQDSEDYTVRHDSNEIGTISTPPPVGDRFALAGRVWEVSELDVQHRLIYVTPVEGKMAISWPGGSGEVHTRILEKMREVLESNEEYPYLMDNAKARLETARHLAQNTGVTRSMILPIGGQSYCMFPWLGTRAFRTLTRFLKKNAGMFGLSDISYEGCFYITFKTSQENFKMLPNMITRELSKNGVQLETLVRKDEFPAFDKYDPMVPRDLLCHAFVEDRLCEPEVLKRFL